MAGFVRYLYEDKEPKKSDADKTRSNSIYMRNKVRSEASLSNVQKIYKYLNGGTSGMMEFCDMLKAKYPEAHTASGGRGKWDFGTDIIMEEIWKVERFIPKLEAEGLDDFNRLQYWANKAVNMR